MTDALARRWRRIAAVARIELLYLLGDRTALSLLLVVPAIQILLFGYAVDLDPHHVPIAIAGDEGPAAAHLRQVIDASGYFTVVGDRLAPGAAEAMLRRGQALVAIELPADPEAAASPRVIVDGADPASVRPAVARLEAGYWREVARLKSLGEARPIAVEWRYNPGGSTAWALVPGLAGVIMMISMLMLGALTLVRERERGTWEALLATPVRPLDALAGKLSPYLVLGSVQAFLVVALGHALFGLPLGGDPAALAACVPVYAAGHLILGFACSALARTQIQAIQAAVFFYLPSMLLSGFMFPFDGMPGWARALGEALPLTHFVRAARGVLLRGYGAALVARETWPMALFALAAAALAVIAYRRRID